MMTFSRLAAALTGFAAVLRAGRLAWGRFGADEGGQDLIEYALVAALVALAAVSAIRGVSSSISKVFNSVSANLNTSL